MIGIYKITSPSGRVYIGQSINIIKRFNQYRTLNISKQRKLHNSFKKHSVENHVFEIIEECTVDLLNERERYWQEYYLSVERGLNCLYTKTDTKRAVYDKNSSKARSISQKGKNKGKIAWNKGKTNIYSKEVLDKMSIVKKGKPNKSKGIKRPNNSGENNPFYGKKRIEISLRQKGKDNPMYGKTAINAKQVIDTETGKIFSSIKEAAIFYDLKYTTLQQKINGTRINNTNLKFKNHDKN